MRYYNLVVNNSQTNETLLQYSSTSDGTINGVNNGAALRVDFDIPITNFSSPMGDAWIRLWGPTIKDVSQAINFKQQNLEFSIGMTAGLPLADPTQAGLAIKSQIFQAVANWQGTLLSLDFFVLPIAGTTNDPVNIPFVWTKGTQLGPAIEQALRTAYSPLGYTINPAAVSPLLVAPETQSAQYQTIPALSGYTYPVSRSIIKDPLYAGVQITCVNKTISIFDGTVASTAKELNLNDFISQPTWIAINVVSIELVARADIVPGIYVKLPPFLGYSSYQSMTSYRNNSIFTGVGIVVRVRHVGNSRQTDGNSWSTIIDVVFGPKT